MKLTAVIITKNEEKDLGRTLASLGFVDEIVIVDSFSTDRTVTVAKAVGAKVTQHRFVSYSQQRNFADSQVGQGWILSLDADVVVPHELGLEIRQAIKGGEPVAYRIGRVNVIWGRPITVADWGPRDDCHIWLYQKGVGAWQSLVHEEYVTTQKVGKLKNNLIHYNYETVSEYIDKINSYSELAVKSGHRTAWWSPFIDFGKRYFYKSGWQAGYHGLFLCYLQAVYLLTLGVKARGKRYT